MSTPSSPSTGTDETGGTRTGVRKSIVPAFYASMLLALLVVAAYGEGVHPLLAAALGVGLVFCWVSWPAYRESVER